MKAQHAMRVYVVQRDFDYEGKILCGIFSSRELAQAWIDTADKYFRLEIEEWWVDVREPEPRPTSPQRGSDE